MTPVNQLWSLLDRAVHPLAPRRIALEEAGGLTLAEPIFADADQPAFDRSAMDGFAIRQEAAPGGFRLIGVICPGEACPPPPGAREAWRVYTGAALPPGVRVIRQEDAALTEATVRIAEITGPLHVRYQGSAVRRGGLLLPKGVRLGPAELAIAAGAGAMNPLAIPPPRVVHLTTGREVVPPQATPRAGEIRDTNGPLVRALLREAGAGLVAHAHAGESIPACLEAARAAGTETADLLLVSGGSSVGDYDGTAALLEQLGYTVQCRAVNCRPGKPLLVGFQGNRIAFGLPGNPVSHFVAFHLFVRQVIERFLGRGRQRIRKATLKAGAPLEANPRETFWPARFAMGTNGPGVTALPWLDSGQLNVLAGVNALIRLDPKLPLPGEGERVDLFPCYFSNETTDDEA